jgi:ammonium transporter, Amt family
MTSVETVDIGWLLVCAALVLFMQAGFTALESGLVRSKNSINVARTAWAVCPPTRLGPDHLG